MNANVKSVGVKDVDQSEFVKALAAFLKKYLLLLFVYYLIINTMSVWFKGQAS